MIRNILIFGGTGNLSYTVARILLCEGFYVTCLTRGTNNVLEKNLVRLGATILHYSSKPFKLDLPFTLQPDYIIDFVAYSSTDIDEHVRAFINIGFQRYVFISTTAFYTRTKIIDPYYSECDFDPNHPWQYAFSKFKAECYLKSLSTSHNINALSLRLGHTLGHLIPVYLGNSGHAIIDHVQETGIVPISGNIMQDWSIGTAEGLGQVLAKLIYSESKLPPYTAVHFSEYITRWIDIISHFLEAVNPAARIYNLPFSIVESISPKWLPSIKYHKQYSDKYNLGILSSLIEHEPTINLQKIISDSVLFTRSQNTSTRYFEDRSALALLCEH